MRTLNLPTRGCFTADISNMWDPHKIGNVMWSRIPSGEMVPVDLHGRISQEDIITVHQVYGRLMAYRKVRPALEVLKQRPLEDGESIKPYMIASMETRSEARELMATDDWMAIWSYL